MSDVSKSILRVQDLHVYYPVETGTLFKRQTSMLKALNGVSFELAPGESLGIVGESGCGKSTLARAILGLQQPTSGRVLWQSEPLHEMSAASLREKRKELQIIFQDPTASLNPRLKIGDTIAEPLHNFYPRMDKLQVEERVKGMMQMVGLLPNMLNRYPHEFSGGQCQRVGIARALILNPKLVVCDEPVSSLDVSIQAQIVNLLKDLQKKLSLSLIFIAHDLSVVKSISERVMVMYLGKVMELAPREEIYTRPRHPYTSDLMRAVPIPDPEVERNKMDIVTYGDTPSPMDPPSGCPFRTRCPWARKRCAEDVPILRRVGGEGKVACHYADEIELPK
ncbi:MAG: ATP-binding cassette domain-containing protein [Xanthomonadales bacterium]|nr:ATP-binding cassette domain-containing protein [Xanthomonadales bacterium]